MVGVAFAATQIICFGKKHKHTRGRQFKEVEWTTSPHTGGRHLPRYVTFSFEKGDIRIFLVGWCVGRRQKTNFPRFLLSNYLFEEFAFASFSVDEKNMASPPEPNTLGICGHCPCEVQHAAHPTRGAGSMSYASKVITTAASTTSLTNEFNDIGNSFMNLTNKEKESALNDLHACPQIFHDTVAEKLAELDSEIRKYRIIRRWGSSTTSIPIF